MKPLEFEIKRRGVLIPTLSDVRVTGGEPARNRSADRKPAATGYRARKATDDRADKRFDS